MDPVSELSSISKSTYSPRIQDFGLAIEFSKNESTKERKVIQGTFALPKSEDADKNIKVYGQPHKAIVVTINFDGRYSVVKPFEEVVVLGGDVEETKIAHVGYFQFNIYDYFEYTHPGIYYVVSSLGIYVSNILQISIE